MSKYEKNIKLIYNIIITNKINYTCKASISVSLDISPFPSITLERVVADSDQVGLSPQYIIEEDNCTFPSGLSTKRSISNLIS